jgi:hypothetical protein
VEAIAWFVLALFVEHAVDAAISYRITKKGLHPKSPPNRATAEAA